MAGGNSGDLSTPVPVGRVRVGWVVGPSLAVGAAMLACMGTCAGVPCATTGLRYGLWLDRCPASDLRLDLDVSATGLLRGQRGGVIEIVPRARWLDGEGRTAYERSEVLRRGFSWDATLVDAAGAEVPGMQLRRRRGGRFGFQVPATLPDVPDGDYTLKVQVDAGFDEATVDVPLPVYAPAIVHLMTDRPLYRPGQEVLLRSVVLRRTDLTPLEGRPGRWRIVDPTGTELLVEKDQAGPWGVADGSFPLDREAAVGRWRAIWESGDARDEVPFDVRPFRLPRTEVVPTASQSWFKAGDELAVEGRARFTSGAPMRDAPVQVALRVTAGRWTLPVEWEEPHTARTGPDGRFRVSFGAVPPDLVDRTTLTASVSATDPTGEVASAAVPLYVSRDGLLVEALTELGGGLVEGFNNRTYLRVSRPDGTPMPATEITVQRAYDPSDPGKAATTDADGVAALQIDPGPPVTVVIPAPPYRPHAAVAAPPQLVAATLLGGTGSLGLDERRVLDGRLPALSDCRAFALGDQDVPVGVQVDASGSVRDVTAADDPLSRCVAAAMQGATMPAGKARTFALTWRVPDAQLPSVGWLHRYAFGSAPVGPVLERASLQARRCLPGGQGVHGAQILAVHWTVDEGSTAIATLIDEEGGHGLPPAAVACLRGALGGLRLEVEAAESAMGVAVATLSVPRPPGAPSEQAWTQTGYELLVREGGSGADGRVVVGVGTVPPLRLRAEPSLASPGDEVTIEMLRGPGWFGELPEELALMAGTAEIARGPVADNRATLKIPADARGFVHVEWGGARTVVFVRDPAALSLELASSAASYRPGDVAEITVSTRAGDAPVAAAVGLVGVDSALAQLAPLVPPTDFGRVTVRAASAQPAFGAFDPRALTLGEVRGENAAKAAVLSITALPMDPAGDAPAGGSATARSETEQRLQRNFYRALARATAKVRQWEQNAATGELLAPEQMVGFWEDSLRELASEGDPAVDGYGRELGLDVLPMELVALTDPRTLVVDAARLPEDFVGWTQYVVEGAR